MLIFFCPSSSLPEAVFTFHCLCMRLLTASFLLVMIVVIYFNCFCVCSLFQLCTWQVLIILFMACYCHMRLEWILETHRLGVEGSKEVRKVLKGYTWWNQDLKLGLTPKCLTPPPPSFPILLPPGLLLSYFLHLLSIFVALDTKFILHLLLC